MKVLMCVAVVAALAFGFSLTSVADADAGCRVGWRCNQAVLVPAPNPIPLRRLRPRVVAPAPCVSPCGLPPGPTAYRYRSPKYYA